MAVTLTTTATMIAMSGRTGRTPTRTKRISALLCLFEHGLDDELHVIQVLSLISDADGVSLRMVDPMVIVGDGNLASTITKMFTHFILVAPSDDGARWITDGHQPILFVEEGWDVLGRESQLLRALRAHGTTILPVSCRMNKVYIGPLEHPGVPGCSTCFDIHWHNAIRRAPLLSALHTFKFGGIKDLSPLSNFLTAKDISFAVACLEKGLLEISQGNSLRWNGQVEIIHAGASRLQTLSPSNDCLRCQQLFTDARSPDIEFQSHSIGDPSAVRVKDLDLERLQETFVDTDVGFVSSISALPGRGPQFGVNAHIQLSNGQQVTGYGASLTRDDAERIAILEALERSCGRYPVSPDKSVIGTYRELESKAVHPRIFGVHDEDVYETANPRYVRFREDTPYHWVQAYSCNTRQSVLVPEQLAYHRSERPGEKHFVQQTSNGCAVGGTMEEAILYSLLETIERDAFLNTWYAELPLPELLVDRLQLSESEVLFEAIQRAGYEVRYFNMSHDFAMPSVLAVAVCPDRRFPKVAFGTATHIHLSIAIRNATRELSTRFFGMMSIESAAMAMAQHKRIHPDLIETIRDHKLVGALPESYEHWAFLLDAPRRYAPIRLSPENLRYRLQSNDIRQVLEAVLAEMDAHGFDVIVVPQTRLELAAMDLHAVRVLVPGMIPMTFGHRYRRIQGIHRVLHLPHQLGYTTRPLLMEELNNHPHPFA